MTKVLIVLASHYRNWERQSDGEIEVLDEETDGLGVVGAYATVKDCAEACHSFINEFDPDEEVDGPIDNVVVLAVEVGAKPGELGDSVEVSQSWSQQEIEEQLRKTLG